MKLSDFKNSAEPLAIKRMSVVVPVYNGEKTIEELVGVLFKLLDPLHDEVEVVLVNDGSQDDSHRRLIALSKSHEGRVKYVQLARNFGEHNAVMCGLRFTSGDAVAVIDDNFQNAPEEIPRLVAKLKEGYDVVYSYYTDRKDSAFRRWGSRFNDRVATWMLGKPKSLYLSSFKCMNRFMVDSVTNYDGPFPYVDGIILRATRSIAQVECQHSDRQEGKSGYTFVRLVRLWMNMFTGFSILPLRLASYVGMITSVIGILLGIFFMVSRILGGVFGTNSLPPGWASLIVCVTIFAGLQLSMLGVLGEYLGRLFLTINRMPQFVIRETFGKTDDPQS